jgi:hypothetical protein
MLTLYRKRIFADVIKDLEIDYFGLPRWAPNVIQSVL